MSIMNRLTLKTLRLNRMRTLVTIIGIILSAAMFTAVFTICMSLYHYMHELEVTASGSYHIHAVSASAEGISEAQADGRTEYAALTENLGYAKADSANPDKPYICVLAADGTFFANMPVNLIEGRLPENSNEIVVSDHARYNGGMSFSVGDTLTLSLGTRCDASSDQQLRQEKAYLYEQEELRGIEERSFTIVGICERPDFEPYSAPGYTFITKLEGGMAEDGVYDCYIRVKDPRRNFYDYGSDHRGIADQAEAHSGLLMLEGVTQYGNISRVLTGFAVILSLLVFVGSVALIYSAFSISVSERTKQFGLLSSIGATKKQIRRSVFFEAAALSAVGIPLGIAAGVGGIAITLWLLRDKFASIIAVSGSEPLGVYVTWPVLLLAAAIAFATVLVSAWIPSIRAMRITPIEAIRQTRDVKAGKRKARYPRLAAKLFGAEGLLAKKYYTRSSKKYRATILSLAMSVILFVAASCFCMYLTRSVNSVDNAPDYDVMFSPLSREAFERLRPSLSENAAELAGYIMGDVSEYRIALIPEADSTDEYLGYIKKTVLDTGEVAHNQYAQVLYMDDAAFRELLKKNGLNEEGWFDPEAPRAIVVNSDSVPVYERHDDGSYSRVNYVFDYFKKGVGSIRAALEPDPPEGYDSCGNFWSGERYGEGELLCWFAPSDDENVEYDEHRRPIGQITAAPEFTELKIGALIEEPPCGSFTAGAIEVIYPMSVYTGSSGNVRFFFRSDRTSASIEAMTGILEGGNITVTDRSFYDVTEEYRVMNNIVTIIKVFSYGFITLISLISIANVFNTVTTNVALRRRDYAMLRSMGMTQKGMDRMSNFECLIYGSRSLMIGLPIAALLSFLIYKVASDASVMRFELPWTAIAIAVVSVFLVVFLSMLYSTHKLRKDNPIDALKDENI